MRADRLLSIMLLLQQKGQLTAWELANRLEVTVRTIYRDVSALCNSGIPIYTQSGPHGGIFLDADYRVALRGFSQLEVQSLAVEGGAQPLSDLGFGHMMENTYLKLLAALPGMQQAEVEKIRKCVYLDPKGWFHVQEELPFLSLMQHAVLDDEEIEILYEKADGTQTRRHLQPYGLVCKSNIWYLVSKIDDGGWRTFRVSRLRGVRKTGIHFEREQDFRLKTYWEHSSRAFEDQFKASYPTVLRVHPDLISHFEWYLSGRFISSDEPNPLGWIDLQILFYSQQEARMTVMGLGNRVKIIAPPDLQENVLEYAKAIIAQANESL